MIAFEQTTCEIQWFVDIDRRNMPTETYGPYVSAGACYADIPYAYPLSALVGFKVYIKLVPLKEINT